MVCLEEMDASLVTGCSKASHVPDDATTQCHKRCLSTSAASHHLFHPECITFTWNDSFPVPAATQHPIHQCSCTPLHPEAPLIRFSTLDPRPEVLGYNWQTAYDVTSRMSSDGTPVQVQWANGLIRHDENSIARDVLPQERSVQQTRSDIDRIRSVT